MKLAQKFTIWYFAVTFVVLAIGGIILFFSFRAEVDFEEALMLRERLDRAAARLERGVDVERIRRHNIEVRELDMALPEIEFERTDTLAYHEMLQRQENQVKVIISRKINGKHYYLSSYYGLVESDDITDAVVTSLFWIILLLLIVSAILSVVISRTLFSPFYQTLAVIQSFQLKRKEPVQLPATKITEFKQLNIFLAEMMDKAKQDYQALKEFTENASHEMQTPVAIMRGKLELMLDTPLSDEQARLIVSTQNALDKLSKMGQSLTLLTKIENKEFSSPEPVNISQILSDSLFAFEELIEMKDLKIEQQIEEGIMVAMHPVLADILISNLLSNAIRHNVEGGCIGVELNSQSLTIRNTGLPLEVDEDEMFGRFKKGKGNSDSVGLGLAIVKRICDQNQLEISYQNKDPYHIISILLA